MKKEKTKPSECAQPDDRREPLPEVVGDEGGGGISAGADVDGKLMHQGDVAK